MMAWIEGAKVPVAKDAARGEVEIGRPDHAHGVHPVAKPRPPKPAPAEAAPVAKAVEAAGNADKTKTRPQAPATSADLRAAPTDRRKRRRCRRDRRRDRRPAGSHRAPAGADATATGGRAVESARMPPRRATGKDWAVESARGDCPAPKPPPPRRRARGQSGGRPPAPVPPRSLPPAMARPTRLQEIEGIGPVLEKLCHDLGIFHFDQIAGWGPRKSPRWTAISRASVAT